MAVALNHSGHDGPVTLQTVIGLFDDHIDAEQALIAIRKATGNPEQVSLIVRDRAAEERGALDEGGAVARVLVATALDAVGGWLQGLASLIVPRHGTFLVAGPIGAALTGLSDARATGDSPGSDAWADPGALKLNLAIQEFGFDTDEAEYIERRLEAGVALIAVTSRDSGSAQQTQRLFAENSAVHIGRANTDAQIASQLTALLARTARSFAGSDIVVADAVAPLRHLCAEIDADPSDTPCGALVVDAQGEEFGAIGDILVDPATPAADGTPTVRYVVVTFGGVFGLGRRHVPIPATLVDLKQEPVRLAVNRAALESAPSVSLGQPFSRHEEQELCGYFDIPCYWEE
ncbi:MAG TPA: PRC-barrel domain-containing protein [Thermomicrobiales bacterium]|nr:PRC-barrel domain-containing protein [Thermomicrobiales bacterium]